MSLTTSAINNSPPLVMQYASKTAPVTITGIITQPLSDTRDIILTNISKPAGLLGFLQNISPWTTAILEAFGKQTLWGNIVSSLGILWNSGSSLSSQGLGAASLDLVKFSSIAGLGGTYGISWHKKSLENLHKPIFGKGWVQVLVGLAGVIGLAKLSELFDNYIKNKILGLFNKNS